MRSIGVATVAATVAASCRFVHIGVVAPKAEVEAATGLPKTHITDVCYQWAEMDIVARARLAPLAATCPSDGSQQLSLIYTKTKPPSKKKLEKRSKKAEAEAAEGKEPGLQFDNVVEMVSWFEEAMLPIMMAVKQWKELELEMHKCNDIIKIGPPLFTEEVIAETAKERVIVMGKMDSVRKGYLQLAADSFNTAIFNDIINTLRIAMLQEGPMKRNEDARTMALRVFECMNWCEIPFDGVTQQLLKSVVFEDGIADDSAMLMSCVEYPERGEVSAAAKDVPLADIAKEAMEIVSKRHSIPLDPMGKFIQSQETHPMLQRSPN